MPYDVIIRDDPAHPNDMDVEFITVGLTLEQALPRSHAKFRMIRVGSPVALVARVAGNHTKGGSELVAHVRAIEDSIDRTAAKHPRGIAAMDHPFATVVADRKRRFMQSDVAIEDAEADDRDVSAIRPERAAIGTGTSATALEQALTWRKPPKQAQGVDRG